VVATLEMTPEADRAQAALNPRPLQKQQ
jgi:hypothetical protein